MWKLDITSYGMKKKTKKTILYDVHGTFNYVRSRLIDNMVDGVSKSFTSSISIGLIVVSRQMIYGKN